MEDDNTLGRREILVGSLMRREEQEWKGGIRHWGAVELHGLRSPLAP